MNPPNLNTKNISKTTFALVFLRLGLKNKSNLTYDHTDSFVVWFVVLCFGNLLQIIIVHILLSSFADLGLASLVDYRRR